MKPGWPGRGGRAVVATLALLLGSCAAGTPPSAPRADGHGSVVALLRLEPAKPLNTSSRDQYERECSAFAVRGLNMQPGVWLVTAQHCVLASRMRYLSPDGWGHSFASVEFSDAARDLALLQPDKPGELVPYAVGARPSTGESVRSVSAVYQGESSGRFGEWLSGPFYETTQTIVFGWSGSPVLDSDGKAFALVSQCPFDAEQSPECMPGSAIVSTLQ